MTHFAYGPHLPELHGRKFTVIGPSNPEFPSPKKQKFRSPFNHVQSMPGESTLGTSPTRAFILRKPTKNDPDEEQYWDWMALSLHYLLLAPGYIHDNVRKAKSLSVLPLRSIRSIVLLYAFLHVLWE
jgi:hypothetical protein